MADTVRQRWDEWGLHELISTYPGLRLLPVSPSGVRMSGPLEFSAQGRDSERIDDSYDVDIRVPFTFPRQLPHIWETGGRISSSFHKLTDGSLCLGSETRLRLAVSHSTSLLAFIEHCLIPYLYGHSYFEKHNAMPFGELSHGAKGIIEDLADLLSVSGRQVAGFVQLGALKKRVANKHPCPCGSEQRLGKCHHRQLNGLRNKLGRSWFRYLKSQVAR